MSYEILYQFAVFQVSAAEIGLNESRFVIAVECGSNNCYEIGSNRRSRSWQVDMIGTETQVIQKAVSHAGACASGSLKPKGTDCSPESYIRRIRRLLAGPPSPRGGWLPRIRVPVDHPIRADLSEMGIEMTEQTRWNRPEIQAAFPPKRLGDFFRLVDRYHKDLPAWDFAQVWGLPSS